mmetsp:Transcript_20618/g.59729  ORF Transcript_20618/g.59729 Transcript_20618/m.59729 type:complete len:175 (-) Transcript_20618:104-628(-)
MVASTMDGELMRSASCWLSGARLANKQLRSDNQELRQLVEEARELSEKVSSLPADRPEEHKAVVVEREIIFRKASQCLWRPASAVPRPPSALARAVARSAGLSSALPMEATGARGWGEPGTLSAPASVRSLASLPRTRPGQPLVEPQLDWLSWPRGEREEDPPSGRWACGVGHS